MKVWHEHGSEHSMNLVMIGYFKEVHDAEKAKKLIDQFTEQVRAEPNAYRSINVPEGRRFSDKMMELMKETGLYNIGPDELDQYNYYMDIGVEGNKIVIKTEEADMSAVLKLLIEKGARVEVYSAHDYPDTEYGRGR